MALTLAFEGINGAGKSRIIAELQAELSRLPGNRVFVAKIGGLGTGGRMDRLRAILASREEKARRQGLNAKELADSQRDAIFRLAYRYQVRQYLASNATTFTHVLFDRTPLMSWAYTAAAYPASPFIEEVRNEAIEKTATLALRWAFVLEVSPATVYGRVLARHAKIDPDRGTVDELIRNVQAPKQVVRDARQVALALLADPACTGKPFSIWDYMAYEDILRQFETYRTVVARAAQLLGFEWRRIDGENEVRSVVREIRATLGDAG